MRTAVGHFALAISVLLFPLSAFAQSGALTGTVRDSSGAVLPGVNVEASSDALTGRVRSAVTDGAGQYRIIDLRPGIYALTFKLSGFQTVVRDGIELSGAATLTIPVEMQIGNIQESVVIQAETPVIDVQTARHEFVVKGETINTLPISRGYGALLTTIPALMTSGTAETVSSPTAPQMTFFTAHGGTSTEGRVNVDGMIVAAAFGGGGVSTVTYDISNASEVSVTIAGGLGESETGGPSINIVPKSGGNTFRGSAFASGTGDRFRSDNVTDDLRAIGIRHGNGIIKQWDASGSYGGPLKRNRLWFYATARNYSNMRPVEGVVANANAGNPNRWDYVRDEDVVARQADSRNIYSIRLTSQATAKQRVSFSYQYERRCDGSAALESTSDACRGRGTDWVALGNRSQFGNFSPEAHSGYMDTWYKVTQATWTMPASNRLLFDGGYSRLAYIPGIGNKPPDTALNLIPVTEQANIYGVANWVYRGISTYSDPFAATNNWRASASYVTGSNGMKVGYQGGYYVSDTRTLGNENLLDYRFNNQIPNRVTFRIAPYEMANRTATQSIYVQEQWTKRRLTLSGALRYDRASSWSPAEHNGAPVATFFNAQPIRFERVDGVTGYHDLTPRFNVAYDVFGTGKTAVKFNGGKYLDAATNDGIFDDNNPALRVAGGGINTHPNTYRDWTDGNGNKIVECDLLNPLAHSRGGDTCGTWNNLNFGNPSPLTTIINPDLLHGWGVRPYDWQIGVSLQQEVLPRVSAEVSYNRRSWGNYTITDNQTRSKDDYDPWSVTAPVDPRLPNGGGYQFTVYNLKPAKLLVPGQNWVAREIDYGYARKAYWHGVDATVNARLRNGLIFQGGTSTGRGVRDRCEIQDKVPELFDTFGLLSTSTNIDARGCHQVDRWATALRALSTYTVPKIDVLVSATIRSTLSIVPFSSASNGLSQLANYSIPNTVVQQSLGRLPAGGTITGNTLVNLVVSGEVYPDDRITLVDMRFAKILRLGGRRLDFGVDLYNLFNSSFASIFDNTYDYAPTPENPQGWMQPTTIVQPRFVRLNVTVDF